MKFAFLIFPPLHLVIVWSPLALTNFHVIPLVYASCIRNCLRRIDCRLNHRIKEAGMGFRGLLRVKYFIWAW